MLDIKTGRSLKFVGNSIEEEVELKRPISQEITSWDLNCCKKIEYNPKHSRPGLTKNIVIHFHSEEFLCVKATEEDICIINAFINLSKKEFDSSAVTVRNLMPEEVSAVKLEQKLSTYSKSTGVTLFVLVLLMFINIVFDNIPLFLVSIILIVVFFFSASIFLYK